MQGEEVIYEEYSYPYSSDMPHTLFSVTKSVVSEIKIENGKYTRYIVNPETGEKIFCARNMREKEEQRLFFFWYKSEEQKRIKMILKKIGRQDLLKKLGIR